MPILRAGIKKNEHLGAGEASLCRRCWVVSQHMDEAEVSIKVQNYVKKPRPRLKPDAENGTKLKAAR